MQDEMEALYVEGGGEELYKVLCLSQALSIMLIVLTHNACTLRLG